MTDYDSHRAEYMFGLLGYSTWNLYDGRIPLGQVTLNEVDRSSHFTPREDSPLDSQYYMTRSWEWWMKWLRRHRHETF